MQQDCYKVMEVPSCTTLADYMTDQADHVLEPERLKRARERMHYSQQEIADKLGITAQSYSAFERGVKDPSSERLKQFCKILECSADYLLGLTPEPDETIEVKALPKDEQNLLEGYRKGKIPRIVKRFLSDPASIEDDRDIPLIESGDERDVPRK